MVLLARDLAKKIEDELEYPGQIKVNIVRETQCDRLRKVSKIIPRKKISCGVFLCLFSAFNLYCRR